jgi:hypothetical protein
MGNDGGLLGPNGGHDCGPEGGSELPRNRRLASPNFRRCGGADLKLGATDCMDEWSSGTDVRLPVLARGVGSSSDSEIQYIFVECEGHQYHIIQLTLCRASV